MDGPPEEYDCVEPTVPSYILEISFFDESPTRQDVVDIAMVDGLEIS